MPDTESDHHRGADAAFARLDLVTTPAAPATTTSICATGSGTATVRDEDEEDGFTFAAAVDVAIPRLQDADADDCAFPDARRIGSPVYPVFGRPRRSLSLPKQRQQEERHDEIEEVEEEEDSAAAARGTVTVRRVPLGRLLLEEQGAPSATTELDGVPAETYCLWSPGVSPLASAGSSRRASPARLFRKSRSTGSSVIRWRRRRRSHSNGKDDKFVSLGTSSDCIVDAGKGQGRINRGSPSPARGGGKSSSSTAFLQCKQDLVELVTDAVTCGRSCYLF